MPIIEQIVSCCGIGELRNLGWSSPKRCLDAVYDDAPLDYNLIVFTDRNSNKQGQQLATYIRRHKLGRVDKSRTVTNPQHGSRVCMWLWYVNRKALKKWYKKEHPNEYNY